MASDMRVDYRIRPISAREYHLMSEQGIIGPDERVELLDGELIAMPPIGPDHAFSIRELNELFVMTFGGRARVDVQSSMALEAYSEPEPDLMLLRLREDRYRTAIPAPSDVLLVIEVANSSWRYDRGRKLRAYARNGIAELWIVHLAASCVIVFRDPKADGYADERSYARGESLAPSAFPNDPIPVEAILP